jgi:hypothetical protein
LSASGKLLGRTYDEGTTLIAVESHPCNLAERVFVVKDYTQLSNPTSNAIYRAIGYEPVSEILRYRFG